MGPKLRRAERARRAVEFRDRDGVQPGGRGLHSSTVWLNVSAFCVIGGVIRGYIGGVWQALGGVKGCLGYILCQKRLRLS